MRLLYWPLRAVIYYNSEQEIERRIYDEQKNSVAILERTTLYGVVSSHDPVGGFLDTPYIIYICRMCRMVQGW